MTRITIEKEKLEKVFYALTAAKHGNLDNEWTEEVLAICKQALAAPTVQEPVTYCEIHHLPEPCVQCAKEHEGYNTAPPTAQRPWVGLTDEEIEKLRESFATRYAIEAIEAKLKEKNT